MWENFDEVIDRRGTDSAKWDAFEGRFPGLDARDCLPMWVADTDFRCPSEAVEAVVQKAQFGLYGYPSPRPEGYLDAVSHWLKKRHGWSVEQDWILLSPGVVPAITLAIQAFTREGDGVIISPPVYYPFRRCIENNRRKVVNNPLVLRGEQYEIDFEDFRRKAAQPENKLFILCNPHNPVGRVWSREELTKLVEICLEHDVLIFSDEIHGDLVFEGHRHISTGTLGQEVCRQLITGFSASKTFNLAGLKTSSIIIPDEVLREKFLGQMERNSMSGTGPFGPEATVAVYRHGEGYLKEFLAYIARNIDYAIQFTEENLPGVRVIRPQGTYLVWFDCREAVDDPKELDRLLIEEAKLAVDLGTWFGSEGAGFFRINLACPRETVAEGLGRLARALTKKVK